MDKCGWWCVLNNFRNSPCHNNEALEEISKSKSSYIIINKLESSYNVKY